LATYAAGHAVASLPELLHHLQAGQQVIAAGLASLIPNLGEFTYRNQAVYRLPMGLTELGQHLAYGAAWCALLVTITVAVIRRKQL
jgi:hypothetical protein